MLKGTPQEQAHDRGVIQFDFGSIVPLLRHYCPSSLVEGLSTASTVTHIGMMTGGTVRYYFASLH